MSTEEDKRKLDYALDQVIKMMRILGIESIESIVQDKIVSVRDK